MPHRIAKRLRVIRKRTGPRFDDFAFVVMPFPPPACAFLPCHAEKQPLIHATSDAHTSAGHCSKRYAEYAAFCLSVNRNSSIDAPRELNVLRLGTLRRGDAACMDFSPKEACRSLCSKHVTPLLH
jgi:hypothetical protein